MPPQPAYAGVPTPHPAPPALRVVRAPQSTPASHPRRGRPASTDGAPVAAQPAGRHAQRSASTGSSLAEVQIGVSVLQLADQVLAEVSVLLRRLRDLASQAANRDAGDRDALQRRVVAVVDQIGLISREVRFDGTAIFDGSLAAREIALPGGGRACVDVAAMNGRTLGLESPWGRATTSRGTRDAQLTDCTGTLPAGTFQVVADQVFGDFGEQVATYDGHAVVDFGGGVSATFDDSLYFQDGATQTRSGVFILDSVLSVRTGSAAEHAIGVIDRAAALVSEQRLVLGWSRSQLAQAATDVLARRVQGVEVLDTALATDGAQGLAQVIRAVPAIALPAQIGAMNDPIDREDRLRVRPSGS